jgi:ATP-binding cassette subfamily F protein uup
VLIVSHDRDFLDNTVTVTLGLDGTGKVDIVAGGYEDWMKQRAAASAPRQRAAAPRPTAAKPAQPSRKLSYRDQHDLDRLPAEIERLEKAIAADEATLHDPDLYVRDPARFAALTKAIDPQRAAKDAAEHRWLEVAEMAEGLGA